MATEIPVLNQYFENVSEIKDARFRDQYRNIVLLAKQSATLQ